MESTRDLSHLLAEFNREGYVVARGLFDQEEATWYRDHFMHLRETGTYPGDFAGINTDSDDPLVRYPRLIHMHRWDEASRDWMLDERIVSILETLLGEPMLGVQTMLYFKPPGARGQALHQDQFYLQAKPGGCIAAWMALDEVDEANGCLRVVPKTQDLPILCIEQADTTQSFTGETVRIPEGTEAVPVRMQPGDVLFFGGQIVHGSYPNDTADRFRRALIGHYVTERATKLPEFYHPALRADGTEVAMEHTGKGGPCGVWHEIGQVEMVSR
ncbi:MAG: phytanoyl-CoA dioxygenase family protein [Bacteroidota bacterium]